MRLILLSGIFSCALFVCDMAIKTAECRLGIDSACKELHKTKAELDHYINLGKSND